MKSPKRFANLRYFYLAIRAGSPALKRALIDGKEFRFSPQLFKAIVIIAETHSFRQFEWLFYTGRAGPATGTYQVSVDSRFQSRQRWEKSMISHSLMKQVFAKKSFGAAMGGDPGPSRSVEKNVFVVNEARGFGGADWTNDPDFKDAACGKMYISRGVATKTKMTPLGTSIGDRRRKPKPRLAPAGRGRLIELTPQMKIVQMPGGKSDYDVSVFLDNNAPDPQARVKKTVIHNDSKTGIYRLVVELKKSRFFSRIGNEQGVIEVSRTTVKSTVVNFQIRLRGKAFPQEGALVEARIYLGEHPCGRIAKRLGATEAAKRPTRTRTIRAEKLPAQDALVEVQHIEGSDGYQLRVKYPGISDDWKPLFSGGRTLQKEIATTFRALENEPAGKPTTNFLRGMGVQLYSKLPETFKQLVEVLLRKTDPTLIVYTDEGLIPWELLVRKVGTKTDKFPIGAHIIMGRWVTGPNTGVPTPPRLNKAFVSVGVPRLPHAKHEEKTLKKFLPESVIKEFTDAHVMLAAWAKVNAPIIHYIGHGSDAQGGQAVVISKTTVTDTHIDGDLDLENRFAKTRPLVFLNACMAGQAPVKYLGAHGLPQSLIGKGASAVVAPNWTVLDATAAAVARRFYGVFRNKKKLSLARVLRDLRRESYHDGAGKHTWAAYSFFGHPAAYGN